MNLYNIYNILPIKFQNFLISKKGGKIKRKRFLNNDFIKWITFLSKTDNFSNNEIQEYQKNKLSDYLIGAYKNSDYWHNQIKSVLKNNVEKKIKKEPYQIIKDLPIINKSFVKKNKELLINKNIKDKTPVHTSGSSGSGLKFYWSQEALAAEYAFVYAKRWNRINFGDKYATFNGNKIVPSQEKKVFWRYNKPLNQSLFSIFHLKDENMNFYIKELKEGNYKFITGYPSALLTIANYILKYNIKLDIKYVYTSSESLYEWQRERIKQAFNCEIFDSYTNTEQSALVYETIDHNYLLSPFYSYVKFIKSSINEKIIEFIGTSFLNHAIYLINYKTEDYFEVKDNYKDNSYNRIYIEKIIGREDDIIYTKDKIPIGRLDHVFKNSEDIKKAQIIQRNYGEIEIIIQLEKNNNFPSKKYIIQELKQRMGKDTKIIFSFDKNFIESKNGKFKGVISYIKK